MPIIGLVWVVGVDFDPLFHDYLQYTVELRKSHAAMTNLPMCPVNMPYYCGPRAQPVTKTSKAADALHIQSLLNDIVILSCTRNTLLSNVPIDFGHAVPPSCRSTVPPRALLNLEFASYTFQAMYFCWAVYLFSNRNSLPRSNLSICLSI
jgi:hypothetical protein